MDGRPPRSLLLAYTCSGFAGLVYQVTWTRLIVLQVGHTTAAVTAVVAAFMGGLGAGAVIGARLARRLSAAQNRRCYAILEAAVAVYAVLLPFGLTLFTPMLRAAYGDGAGGVGFAIVRTTLCLVAIGFPALLLGATFPVSLRIAAPYDDGDATGAAGRLYAINTAGAAIGALSAGFVLLPAIGVFRTTIVAASASIAAALIALRFVPDRFHLEPKPAVRRGRSVKTPKGIEPSRVQVGVALGIAAITGFAGLLYEVSWTRAVASLLGPTTYAFAGTVAVMISGLAIGGGAGVRLAASGRSPYLRLAVALVLSAIAVSVGNAAVGREVPEYIARTIAASGSGAQPWLLAALMVFLVVLPPAIGLGITMPIVLRIGARPDAATSGVALLYGINTAAGVAGTIAFGPLLAAWGLETTLRVVPVVLAIGAAIAIASSTWTRPLRLTAAVVVVAAAAVFQWSPSTWDRELLASGIYKYSRGIPHDVDVASVLKAGDLQFYRDGQFATVSVKDFAGKLSLAIDGKVDGSTGGDMLTQELAAHIPLLLHERPDNVLVVGLGTGVTAAAVGAHPVGRMDVVEISREVIAASAHFAEHNRRILAHPTTRLILGDARSHIALSDQLYDVVISEPSNPWLAGVAALFTQEAFADMRRRLAPGGIACQWVHTYDMSEADFRSIIATFRSVFPDATLWTIGETDVLLVAATDGLDRRLPNVTERWDRGPTVRADLERVGVREPFAVLSLWAGGPRTLATLGSDAPLQRDDRMALEFTAPRAALGPAKANQAPLLRRALNAADVPEIVRRSLADATADQWHRRGAMFERMRLFSAAYADYVRALDVDPLHEGALLGAAVTAVAAGEQTVALQRLRQAAMAYPDSVAVRVAYSQLLAALGGVDDAIMIAARAASEDHPQRLLALKQLAALLADTSDAVRLQHVVADLYDQKPRSAAAYYYAANIRFIEGRLDEAVTLTQRALELDGKDADTWNLQGAALAALGRGEDARRALLMALRYSPDDPSIHTNLGYLSLERGLTTESARWFAGALALDPTSETAKQGWARAVGLPAS